MARPRLPTEEKKSYQVSVSLNSRDYNGLKELSEKAELSPSEVFRRAVKGLTIPSREDHRARLQMMETLAEIRKLGGLLKLVISKDVVSRAEVIKVLRQLDPVIKDLKEAVDKL